MFRFVLSRSADVGADTIRQLTVRPMCRGRCPHRPANYETAPTAGGNRRASHVQPDCFPKTARSAAAARKRRQSAVPPAAALRNRLPGSVPRNGGPGVATGALALLGANPRGSLVLSIIGKNTKRRVPPPRYFIGLKRRKTKFLGSFLLIFFEKEKRK